MSVCTDTAAAALSKRDVFVSSGFRAIVLDERGREWSVDQLETEAANEARLCAPRTSDALPLLPL